MKEVTIEITNYCPHSCSYCSSLAGKSGADYLTIEQIKEFLNEEEFDRINISGGEPLAHPNFYNILQLCKSYVEPRTGFVAVYTNEFDCIMYNANIKPGVRVEANLPVLPNTDNIHVLKMVEQGFEKQRPDIHYSCNWNNCNGCNNKVLKSNNIIAESPCKKD